MRRCWWLIFLLAFFVGMPAAGASEDLTRAAEEELQMVNLERVEAEAARITETVRGWAPTTDFRQMVTNLVRGRSEIGPREVIGALGRYFWREVYGGGILIGKLLLLSVILAVFQRLSSAFERAATSQVAYYACFLTLGSMAVTALGLALRTGREAVEVMVSFIQALLPVLLSLLAAAGGITAAAILHPALLTGLAVIGTVVKNVVLPIVALGLLLSLVDRLSEGLVLSRLADFCRHLGLLLLGLVSTVFLGLLTVQGVGGAVASGVALRTAKYATGAFVPVIGGTLANAFEAVVGTSLLLKSAVGLAGTLLIFYAVAFPAVKILALSFIFRLAGALIQTLEGRMSGCLDGVGAGLLSLFAVVATVGLFCFFATAVVVGLGYLVVMLR
uniref:Stage III sporulation protein AE n=1 Tax=Ammonifex degensii TaxID=42838 RepID=A0A7C1JJR4_9THEO